MQIDLLIKTVRERAPGAALRLEIYEALKEYTDAFILGRSILGRDIHCYKIGKGKKNVLFVGAHHGSEYISASVLLDFCIFLIEKMTRPTVISGINSEFLLQKFTFWCVPCLNPDGVELSLFGLSGSPLDQRLVRMNDGKTDFTHWQANARGVDLNHNYDYGFAEYKEIETSRGISAGRSLFSGEYPESEPETKSLLRLLGIVPPSLVMSLHSQGETVYYSPVTDACRRIAKGVAERLSYSVEIPSGTASYGGLCDYTGKILGIPSLTLELGRGENPISYSRLADICERSRRALIYAPTLV